MQSNLITVKEAAAYLRIPVPTVYYLVQRGQLPAVQIGGRWRIKKDAVDCEILGKSPTGGKLSRSPSYQPQILIADDEAMIHQLIKDVLKDEPYNFSSVYDGKEALNKLQTQKFDLMFLDMVMPQASGDEIYEYVVKHQPQLMVVIITAYIDNKIMERVLSFGPVTVMPKPINVQQLLHLSRTLLQLPHTATQPAVASKGT